MPTTLSIASIYTPPSPNIFSPASPSLWSRRVQNIVTTLTEPEDLAAAHTIFITKIAQVKRMALQDGWRDNRPLDQAERNEEPPD